MSNGVENGERDSFPNLRTCSHPDHDSYLFCPDILKSISFGPENRAKFQPPIDFYEPSNGLFVRPLRIDDYDKGYLELLSQLTVAGALPQCGFKKVFNVMKTANMYFVVVVEDRDRDRIVGSCTLLIEQKFFRNAALRGRIEDVVVSNDYRGKQLGKLLVEICTELGRQHFKCYKMSLDCKEHLVEFYGTFGYKREPGVNTLLRRFDGK